MRLDRVISLTGVVAEGATVRVNAYGEVRAETQTCKVWAKRRIVAGMIYNPETPETPLSAGVLALWTIRYKAGLAPQRTGILDSAGQRWRVVQIRETDPDRAGRDRFLELTAEALTTSGPRAARA